MASQATSGADSSAASLPSAPSVVNTIQAVRSPIWSLPMLSEGQLNVGVTGNPSIVSTPELPPIGQMVTVSVASESNSPVIPLENSSSQPVQGSIPAADGGRSSVHAALAKSLTPRQMSSAVTNLVPAHQTPSPLQASNLTQLASQLPKLTPEVILASMKQLQQQQQQVAAQQSLIQALAASGGGVTTPPLVGGGRVTRGNRTKVLAPKHHHQIHHHQQQHQPVPAMASQVMMPGSAPLMMQQTAPQKIVAPIAAVPPTSTPGGPPHHSLLYGVDSTTSSTQTGPRPTITTNKPRKPCNCKNSQCLKLYCDCFANGEFCREFCNCQNCKNNVEHAEDRAKAVKICLGRNPHAFKPKVGQNKSGDERRHIKGCNCKRSGCLKNYCECYEAKIPCSSNCRCIGCKNLPEKLENKSLMQLADAADIRTQQQRAATSHFMEQLEMSSVKPQPRTQDGHRLPFSFINKDVARATCLCLLEEASHLLMNGKSSTEAEKAVMEEFGRCLTQIINSAQSANDDVDRSMVVH